MNVVKRNSPRSSQPKPRLKSSMLPSPPPRPQKASHLYRAPKTSIRRETNATVDDLKNKGKTRRRRPGSSHTSRFAYERQSSDASLTTSDLPGPPPLATEDCSERFNDSAGDLNMSLPDMNWRTGHHGTPRKARGLHVTQGYDDFSEYMDESHRSHTTLSHHQLQQYNGAKTKRRQAQSVFTYGHLFQLVILLILGGYIYDSHHKVKKHKIQLKQYDEERSHLLEQMMWIDQAAKKVHQKYADLSLMDLSKESKEELTRDVKTAREDLEKLQVRVQMNDRDYIHESYGGKTVEVALNMAAGSSRLAIALSDDTPHAASTFLKQVGKHLWDEIEFSKTESGAIEARSTVATTSPMLEFVEPSRGCHSAGSVALRQEEDRDLIFLSLRINLDKDVPMADTDVCIGKVTQGLHLLEEKVDRNTR